MRAFNWLLTLLLLVGGKDSTQPRVASTEAPAARPKENHVAAD